MLRLIFCTTRCIIWKCWLEPSDIWMFYMNFFLHQRFTQIGNGWGGNTINATLLHARYRMLLGCHFVDRTPTWHVRHARVSCPGDPRVCRCNDRRLWSKGLARLSPLPAEIMEHNWVKNTNTFLLHISLPIPN